MRISQRIRDKLTLSTREKIIRIGVQQSMMVIGGILSALGYVVFQVPYKIAAGGIAGLGIIVNEFTGVPVGAFFLVANIPLFILGYYFLGRWSFVWSSIVAVVVFSVATELFTYYIPIWDPSFPLTDDVLLAAIYAGVLYGIGSGLVYRFGGTVGGTSITARIIYNKTGFPMSQSYLATDLVIILLAGITFSMEVALLALITLVLVGIFSDFVLEGISQTRTVTIITEHPGPIRDAIMHELRRGVSHWEVTGGYSGKSRTMLYLTVLRSRIYDVKFITSRVDPQAFVVVGVSQQTWGGYNARRAK
ncbi:YitT family protein [Desulfofustis glycolicus]|uniref:Uncharacterized membrane-anchored protein YitT, contains DUF161 and DUF2179 domains n=1 Tax=Desulfofustis glycolicus DSM 9705 TaxID=1121409 RepID=A0A1M5VYZ4_9BACT|nr:YitT family protein [Desulfofustis glycolicus]MCB2215189.1 YitT family protein [Desulfobulbaceae bacterium]SHH80143.1 Uncharacterized membrane-anchored protein YitT, contains DUF161 and DUF2179 domains [Desulfofustis glycolicus DSM 9705]